MKKVLVTLLICILIAGVLAGCSSDPIVGTWLDDDNSGDALYFNKNGYIGYKSVSLEVENKEGTGYRTWVKEGNRYFLIQSSPIDGIEEERYEITLDGDELSYTIGKYLVFRYYRKK